MAKISASCEELWVLTETYGVIGVVLAFAKNVKGDCVSLIVHFYPRHTHNNSTIIVSICWNCVM